MTIIQRKDGTMYNLSDYGLRTKDIVVESPSPRNISDQVSGSNGMIDLGTTFDSRKISCVFKMVANDPQDLVLLRNEIFKIFRSDESFYLIDERERGKRWEVKMSNSFSPESNFTYADFTIELICFKGFAESIGTTLDRFNNTDDELWQIGENLPVEPLKFTFKTSTFTVSNVGDIKINPGESPLVITFIGQSTNLQISNTTTGDTWSYTGTTGINDVITLDGLRSTKNATSIVKDTNKSIISLSTGSNNFVISGATGSFTISFNFRFYYL
jgi:hypothetical protein